MKLLPALLVISLAGIPHGAFASQKETYKAKCFLELPEETLSDECSIIDVRDEGGYLKTRNIFSNRFSLTVKSRFDPVKGFVTWDSFSKREYNGVYHESKLKGLYYVMPAFLVQGLPLD